MLVQLLTKQLTTARQLGWLPKIEAATDERLTLAFLLAIASRETNLNPRYCRETGDGGNGFSIFQIDKRSYPLFCASGQWKDVGAAALKAREVWYAKRDQILAINTGSWLVLKTRSGKACSPVRVRPLEEDELDVTTTSAYNSGLWALRNFSLGRSSDYSTTGGDYAADVYRRRRIFEQLLAPTACH